ncbi:amino acid ABC transporter substrate-binding protein, PAAT family [Gloeocapsa sp. PCC 7428]|uniref:transporter substrate-binding domain-containing protein n=1 Tax=Gloeocapsa sp. PCC 7428 TaxID=1173026 RepID=UPI0002A60F29|nr:transporter substrate-binding domain-containing protein [Gloeocapsa sp. PCC 7428]AFZ30592.1 amino acid ABC transporter substrate-binding protein, PAAT family [Gloeocapsa sp. PCC 7428]
MNIRASTAIARWEIPFAIATHAANLPEIQQRGYFIVAVKDNLRPLSYRDTQGNLQGLEIDIAQRLAQDLLGNANAVRFQPVANRDRLAAVIDHKVDLAIANVTVTQSRARLVDFSLPYYFDGTAIVTKVPSVQNLSDFAARKIAVLNGSSTIPTIRYLIPSAQLVGVDSYTQAYSLLESNNADAFAADASVLSGWVQEYPQYRLLPTLLSAEPIAIAMPKGLQYNALRQQVNAAIARYFAQGWLQQRASYWGLPINQKFKEPSKSRNS